MSPETPAETTSTTPADQPVAMTPEELRRQMKMRFDAVNAAEQGHRQRRQDSGSARDTEENKRWERPADAGNLPAGGDNGPSGG